MIFARLCRRKVEASDWKGGANVQGITPFLWFDKQAEEAANFYVSLFPNSKVLHVTRYGEAGPREPGTVMTIDFELDGRPFVALNGGPEFKFTEAISFLINCESQEEIDELWEKLSAGGEKGPCGWLKDKYGVSWQVVPTLLDQMIRDPDAEKSQRVMKAMMEMGKIEIEPLERAYEGREEPARARA
jgi:predicted 3-demethylubiquinone-9 3-methyltransferase (glyoxalase superfamily)